MDLLTLSEQEQSSYHDLFQSCDLEGTGRVTVLRARELFRTAGLTLEILHQITELCGAQRLGQFGRSQFYIALKLIAVAQKGLPVKLESFQSGIDIPLPRFSQKSDDGWRGQGGPVPVDQDIGASGDSSIRAGQFQQQTGHLPPPPAKKHTRNLSGQYRGVVGQSADGTTYTQQILNNSREDSPHDTRSPPFSPKQSPPASPGTKRRLATSLNQQHSQAAPSPAVSAPAAGYAAPQVTVTAMAAAGHVNNSFVNNGVLDNGGWAHFEDDDPSEQHGLLGTGTKKTWDHLDPGTFDTSSISSEADSVDDVWSITEEQREYYVHQFKCMQPDLAGIITGNVAKEFFEKSKLPVHELSKIWQLSDFNKDGALSLEEFCTAMHLVVLRRNEIELPDHLPPSLMPYATLINDEPFAADLPPGSTLKRASPTSPSASQWPPTFIAAESPSSSDVSSPVIKPVNFEMKPPEPDSKILHPVAVRMSPDGHPVDVVDRGRALSDPSSYDTSQDPPELLSPTKQRANTDSVVTNDPLISRPRPIAAKKAGLSTTLPGQLQPLPLPGSSQSEGLSVPDRIVPHMVQQVSDPGIIQPPELPPRPSQHGRSMSMDLKLRFEAGLHPPPAVPPRISPKEPPRKLNESFVFGAIDTDRLVKGGGGTGGLKRFEPIISQEVLHIRDPVAGTVSGGTTTTAVLTNGSGTILDRHRRALSLDYKQLSTVASEPTIHTVDSIESADGPGSMPNMAIDDDDEEEEIISPAGTTEELLSPDESREVDESSDRIQVMALRQASRDKRDIQMALRTHKERNSMLTRSNSELNQELQEVMEQRIALEIQLEHLRPFSS